MHSWSAGIAPLLVALLASWHAAAEPALDLAVPSGIQVGTMVRLDDAKTVSLSPQTAFDVDPDGLPAIADGTAIKLLGSSREFLTLGVLPIDDFAWMRDDKLLLVTQGHLAALSPKGVMLGPALPGPGMRIRPAGGDTAYVFGGASAPLNHDVYLFARDGKATKLASLPLPVVAVAGDGTESFVTAGKTILRIALDQPVRVLLETQDPVISLESAPHGALFYSTKSSVGYIGRNGNAVEFIRGDGGILRARGSMLFVLLSSGNLLRLGPVERFESVPAASSGAVVAGLPAVSDAEPIHDVSLVREIKDRLYELNYDPGFGDATIDDRTRVAIREYEQTSNQATTGEATYGLLKQLRAVGSRAPWGSIVFDESKEKWGMGWGHASRKEAARDARARCGEGANCASEISFAAGECGAFAHSKTGWALAARSNVEWAREAALADCRKRDNNCSILAAICADGSHKYVLGGEQ